MYDTYRQSLAVFNRPFLLHSAADVKLAGVRRAYTGNYIYIHIQV